MTTERPRRLRPALFPLCPPFLHFLPPDQRYHEEEVEEQCRREQVNNEHRRTY